MLTIGIKGTDRGVGATHFAVSTATKLKTYFKRICLYSESNRHLGEELGILDENGEGDFFEYRGIDFLLVEVPIYQLAKEYDVAILEFGTEDSPMFPQTQYQFIVSGGREWNRGINLLEEYERYPKAYYVFPFATDRKEFEIAEGINLIFPEFEPNPFAESKLDLSFMTEEREERSLFSIFRRADKKKMREYENRISSLTDETERKALEKAEMEKKIEEERRLARTDALTGCFNRMAFTEALADAKDYVLICFDVNCLKVANDTYGHERGDKLLTDIIEVIKNHYKNVYRVGGDEFNVITDKAVFRQEDLKAIDKELEEMTERNGGVLHQVAYGFASDGERNTYTEVMSLADSRMYENKEMKKSAMEEEKIKADEERERKAREVEEQLKRVEEEARIRKEEAERKRIEEEDNGLIPNTTAETEEVAETDTSKQMITMWFAEKEIEYKEGVIYHNDRLYVFPTEYRKPLMSLPLVVVKETDGEYEVYTGTDVKINNISVSARFMKDGTLRVSVVSDKTEVVTVNQSVHNGSYTPKNFGKKVSDGELYPIKQNISGTCDCVLVSDGKTSIVNGVYNGRAVTISEKELKIQ